MNNLGKTTRTLDALNSLSAYLTHPRLPKARRFWIGADVVVTEEAPDPALLRDRFYPPSSYVVTPYALEASWLFAQLRDAFQLEALLDFSNKEEAYGRLGNAANRCHRIQAVEIGPHVVYAAVLRELGPYSNR